MTVLEQLVAKSKAPKWAALVERHKKVDAPMSAWGRKGGSHYKDGEFSKK
ncbi:multiple cyclophane-containing RiPP AmcA [Actinokineospora sp.]